MTAPHSRMPQAALGLALLASALLPACSDAPTRAAVLPTLSERLDPAVDRLVKQQVRTIESEPGSGAAHGKLGMIYEANELWTEAAASYANAAALDPADPLWTLHEAITARQAGEPEHALMLLEAVAPRMPQDPAVHNRLAVALMEVGRLDEAESTFKLVLQVEPRAPHGHVGLGDLAMINEQYGKAAGHYEKALQVYPSYHAIHYSLGLAYRYLGRMQDAQRELGIGRVASRINLTDALSAEVKSYAENFVAQFGKAVDAINSNNHQLGVTLLEPLLANRPKDTNVLNNLSAAYQGVNNFQRAEELLKLAIDVDPESFAAYVNLATCYLRMGRNNDALAEADKAVALAPEVGQVHVARARILAALQDYPRAYQGLRKSLEYDKRDAEVYSFLGEVCNNMGRPDEGEQYLRQSIAGNSGLASAHGLLIELLINRRKLPAAEEALNQLAKAIPGHPYIAQMRQKLENSR